MDGSNCVLDSPTCSPKSNELAELPNNLHQKPCGNFSGAINPKKIEHLDKTPNLNLGTETSYITTLNYQSGHHKRIQTQKAP
jgi:hypothetical protein